MTIEIELTSKIAKSIRDAWLASPNDADDIARRAERESHYSGSGKIPNPFTDDFAVKELNFKLHSYEDDSLLIVAYRPTGEALAFFSYTCDGL